MNTVDKILDERGKTNGDYREMTRIIRNLKNAMRDSPNWANLPAEMQESLDMMAHKQGRILAGDFMTPDHWNDIGGYATLPVRYISAAEKEAA